MPQIARTVLIAFALLALGAPSLAQQAPALTRAQIEQIVREYLLNNPEIIVEAIETLEARQRQAKQADQRDAIAAHKDQLYRDADAPVAGNPNGDVTLVEFFDYRCPYCKQVAPALTQLLKEDNKLRFVFKELPILGPDSVIAARAALAANAQGKYMAMHSALLRHRGSYDEATVLRIATEAGLDAARLKADMAKPEIEAMIDRNRSLARALSLTGTPAFIIGDKVVPGAADLETLKMLVAEARKR
ncbi:MAG TPA: DsbA family protein [Alphaproteobacteria bacterium]|nr:DsbA family protein [Alphaproteobacteria bacterium]